VKKGKKNGITKETTSGTEVKPQRPCGYETGCRNKALSGEKWCAHHKAVMLRRMSEDGYFKPTVRTVAGSQKGCHYPKEKSPIVGRPFIRLCS
jgi:hypothetical protein